MANSIGTAWIQIKPSMAGISKDIEKELSSGVEAAGKNTESRALSIFSKIGKTAVAGLAVATTAVAGLAGAAVKSFAEYEQLVGGIETLFKGSSDTVMRYAERAYETAGLSANQYMEQATSFSARLIQGLGGDTAAAARITDVAIQDMADNANKFGTDMELIQNAYQGLAKQNFTMLDNLKLGYGQTAGEMARLVNDSGVMGTEFKATAENVKNIPFDKMIEAIHKTQEEMGITGTTTLEASGTIQGSLRSVKASWSNMLVFLTDESGQAWDDLFPSLLKSVRNFAKNIIPVITQSLFGIANLIEELAPIMVAEIPGLFQVLLPPILRAGVNLILQIVTMLPSLIETLFNALVEILPVLIDALVEIVPQLMTAITELVITVVRKLTEPELLTKVLGGATELFMAIVDALPDITVALVDALPGIIDNMISYLTDPNTIGLLLGAAFTLFMAIVYAVPRILGSLVNAFKNIFSSLWSKIVGIFGGLGGDIANAIGGGLKAGINGVIWMIEKAINVPIDLINGAMNLINKIPGVNIPRVPRLSIPRLYDGGIVMSPTIALVGDNPAGEAVIPLDELDRIGSGKPQIVNNIGDVHIASDYDAERLLEVMGIKQDLYAKGVV